MFSKNAGSLNFISQKLDNVGATQNASSSFSAISIRHSEHLALVTLSIAKGPVTFRFSVISNEVRNPVISRFAIQDFTGWGYAPTLWLGYAHASMVATLAF